MIENTPARRLEEKKVITDWIQQCNSPVQAQRTRANPALVSQEVNMENDFFARMCKEAQDEIASGDKGWKHADTNTLLLACFGLLTNHLTHKLARPLWWFAGAVSLGIIAYIVETVMTHAQ